MKNQINFPIANVISVFLLLIFLSIQSNAQNYSETIFDYSQYDVATDIIKLQEGGFLLVGVINSDSSLNNVFIRLKNNGDTLWTKITPRYGSTIVEFDSCFYMAGSVGKNGVIYKLNKNLSPIWSQSFNNEDGSVFLGKIQKTSKNKLIYTHNVRPDDGDLPPYARLTYSDTSANVIWKKGDQYSIIDKNELNNSNIFNTALHLNDLDPYSWIENYDTLGNANYVIKIGDNFDLVGGTVMFSDTAFVIVSITEKGPMQHDYLKLFKIDANTGSIISEQLSFRTNSFRLRVNSACHGLDDEILVAGKYNIDNSNTMFIFRTNFSGDSISTSIIDKYYDLRPYKIISDDNNFYLIGTLYQEDGTFDIYFLTAPLDTVITKVNIPNVERNKLVEIFPNPAQNKIFVFVTEPEKLIRCNLYNTSGQKALGNQILSNEIDISHLKPGLYIIELELANEKIRKKLIIK